MTHFWLSTQPPWIHLGVIDPATLTERVERSALNDPETIVRILRGATMTSTDAIFDEFAAAFQFPNYFGRNWNAFRDCLGDLAWLPGAGYVAVVTECEAMLADTAAFTALVGVLRDVGDEWATTGLRSSDAEPAPFHTVMLTYRGCVIVAVAPRGLSRRGRRVLTQRHSHFRLEKPSIARSTR